VKLLENWRTRLGGSYAAWRLYHLFVADAVSVQKPTKFQAVYDFMGNELGVVGDLGCGPGVFTRYLCAHAEQVWAADINAASLVRVKGRHGGEKNLAFVVTEAERLPFPDRYFDVVLFLEVLEHLPDDRAGVRELWRVLVPGGKLVISVPVPPGEVDDNPRGHKREGYRLDEIRTLLEGNGFEVQKYHFAQFKFSRLGAQLVRRWRCWLRLPAPIFLTWVGYLDHLFAPEKRQRGDYLPATVVMLARRECRAMTGC
jgi:SAM-dependent methyltransferase